MRIFLLVAALSLLACGSSAQPAPANSPPQGHHPSSGVPQQANASPSCRELARTCHAHDKDSEKAHACHVLGHTAPSEAECAARREECLSECGGAHVPAS